MRYACEHGTQLVGNAGNDGLYGVPLYEVEYSETAEVAALMGLVVVECRICCIRGYCNVGLVLHCCFKVDVAFVEASLWAWWAYRRTWACLSLGP